MTDTFEQLAREIVGRMFRAEETPVDIIATALRTVDEAAFKRGRNAGLEEAADTALAAANSHLNGPTRSDVRADEARFLSEVIRALKEN